jgi:hypothetical protein
MWTRKEATDSHAEFEALTPPLCMADSLVTTMGSPTSRTETGTRQVHIPTSSIPPRPFFLCTSNHSGLKYFRDRHSRPPSTHHPFCRHRPPSRLSSWASCLDRLCLYLAEPDFISSLRSPCCALCSPHPVLPVGVSVVSHSNFVPLVDSLLSFSHSLKTHHIPRDHSKPTNPPFPLFNILPFFILLTPTRSCPLP